MKRRSLLAAASLGLLLAAGIGRVQAATSQDPTGWWYDETKRAGILIQPCGDKLCGRIAWLRNPLDAQGHPKVDAKNSDPKLRTRTLCQLPMIGGFVKTDENKWGNGWIYNPEDGDTYKSHMVLQEDGTLRVRGYVGISWIGKSQIWSRPSEPLPECKP